MTTDDVPARNTAAGPAAGPAACGYCGAAVGERFVRCRRCDTPHHEECFREYGACTVYACGGRSFTQAVRGSTAVAVVDLAPAPATAEAFPLQIPLDSWAEDLVYPIMGYSAGSLALALLADGLLAEMGLSSVSSLRNAVWAMLGGGAILGLLSPFVFYPAQWLVKKTYRYSARRNRLELCWRFLGRFEATFGLLPGKEITGMSAELAGTRHVAALGWFNLYRIQFHRKGRPPFVLTATTNASAALLDRQARSLREVVSAPDLPGPAGWLTSLLSSSYLWLISLALQFAAAFVVEAALIALLVLALS